LDKDIPEEGTKVHFIQLTNGEATLIRLENGETILIDTGSYSSGQELFNYLSEQSVAEIDHLILTNEIDEHMGNLKKLYLGYHVKNVYFPYHLQDQIEELGLISSEKLHALKQNDELTFDPYNKIEILHPGEELALSPQDNSLVFQYVQEGNKILFTSDISEITEKKLIPHYDLHSQILKVSDFGSNQSSSPEFLAEVDAHIGVIFHRPDFYLEHGVLERLEESWMDVYPIKKHGHIIIVCSKGDYELFIKESEKDF
jgi:competence protein ComEC